jgi:hypothetical protein
LFLFIFLFLFLVAAASVLWEACTSVCACERSRRAES